ncbi:MAG: hypothetical protein AAGE01_03000 [Pseudomonadota bacterium]
MRPYHRLLLLLIVALLAACATTSPSDRHDVTGSHIRSSEEGRVAGNARVYCRDAIERTGALDAATVITRSASSARSCSD